MTAVLPGDSRASWAGPDGSGGIAPWPLSSIGRAGFDAGSKSKENPGGVGFTLETGSHGKEPIYFDHCHPLPAANAWIGEALARYIRSEYLTPGGKPGG